MQVENKLKEMGLSLPEVGEPHGNYTWIKRIGNMVYMGGHGPFTEGGKRQMYKGKVGRDVDLETAKASGRLAMLNCLSSLKGVIGDLDKVKQCVRVTTFINAAEGYEEYFKASDGPCDLLVALYGEEKGRPTRMSLGLAQTPHSVPCACDLVVEVED